MLLVALRLLMPCNELLVMVKVKGTLEISAERMLAGPAVMVRRLLICSHTETSLYGQLWFPLDYEFLTQTREISFPDYLFMRPFGALPRTLPYSNHISKITSLNR